MIDTMPFISPTWCAWGFYLPGIYLKARRGLRDLLRKRIQLVQDRSSHLIRFKCQVQMHTGQSIRAGRIKTRKFDLPVIGDVNVQLALQSHLTMIRALTAQIKTLEKSILPQVEFDICFDWLKTAPGIGDILAGYCQLQG
jgi:hypothetical protein